MHKPTTNNELWQWIRAAFGISLPYRAYTQGHSSPFGFIADCFFHPARDVAAWASRSGGKTLGASIEARLEYVWDDGLQSRVLSGSEDQAKFLYQYFSKWVETIYPQQLSGTINIGRTRLNGGQMSILAASQKRVRGPKVQRLYIDEVDEVDHELMEAAEGMGASLPGKPARTVYASTWHRPGGEMGKLIDNCPENGVHLHKWNLWESISQCGEERHEHGRNCGACPLGTDCLAARAAHEGLGYPSRQHSADAQAVHKRVGIAAEPHGIFAVEDAIKRYLKLSRQTIDAEYLCKRPSAEGLVYPSFDILKHGADAAPPDLTIYRTIDWGFNTFVCLWIGMDKLGGVWLLDTYRATTAKVSTHAAFILAHPIQDVRDTFCDPAGRNKNDQTGRSSIDELDAILGIHCRYRTDQHSRNVHNGIKLVRNYLNPASGPPRFHIVKTPQNKIAIIAMQSYHNRKVNDVWLDEPKDPQEYEHIPDALRYFFVNKTQGPSVISGRPGAS